MRNTIKVIENWGVKNQYVITTDKGVIFQSYNSIIAIIEYDKLVFIAGNYKVSKTTGKYRNLFFQKYYSSFQDIKNLETYIDENMIYSTDTQGYILK